MESVTESSDGVDRDAASAWLVEHVAGAVAPFEFRLITGGRSNLTFEVVDANGLRLVLRRPPLGHVLESAHDMAREHRIVSSLQDTAVPVPAALGFCSAPAVIGAPFYVMEFVDGAIVRDEGDVERAFDPATRRAIGLSLIDVLADLHAVDPDAVGLGDLGRKTSYAQRQLRRWHAQFERSKTREIPVIDEVHRRLSACVPDQQRPAIVHGDYRIDNCVIAPDGSVRAVLDWELCTLGDPLADLGLLLVYWARPGQASSALLTGSPTAAAGFPERDELVARYVERTGTDLSELDFYVALGYWKIACIAEGINARYQAGVMGSDGTPRDQFAAQAESLAQEALKLV